MELRSLTTNAANEVDVFGVAVFAPKNNMLWSNVRTLRPPLGLIGLISVPETRCELIHSFASFMALPTGEPILLICGIQRV
jgi:hypothetical protein